MGYIQWSCNWIDALLDTPVFHVNDLHNICVIIWTGKLTQYTACRHMSVMISYWYRLAWAVQNGFTTATMSPFFKSGVLTTWLLKCLFWRISRQSEMYGTLLWDGKLNVSALSSHRNNYLDLLRQWLFCIPFPVSLAPCQCFRSILRTWTAWNKRPYDLHMRWTNFLNYSMQSRWIYCGNAVLSNSLRSFFLPKWTLPDIRDDSDFAFTLGVFDPLIVAEVQKIKLNDNGKFWEVDR